MECVLRLTGRLDRLSSIFYDLAVPAAAKVLSVPDDLDQDEDDGYEEDEQKAPPK